MVMILNEEGFTGSQTIWLICYEVYLGLVLDSNEMRS